MHDIKILVSVVLFRPKASFIYVNQLLIYHILFSSCVAHSLHSLLCYEVQFGGLICGVEFGVCPTE
jgi:hypothetical protein